VHMRLRVKLAYGHKSAFDGNVAEQLLFHAAMIAPVVLTLYLLMLTTRKIAVLVGALHLNEDAVSEVLQYMEQVRSMRARIHDTLATTEIRHSKPDPTKAAGLLKKAQQGELAILRAVAAQTPGGRIDSAQMLSLVAQRTQFVSFTASDLTAYMDRATFESLEPAHKATALTARTLQTGSGDASTDSIEVSELCEFILRHVADIKSQSHAMSVDPTELEDFRNAILQLAPGLVDQAMLKRAEHLTRTKELFRFADADNSGSISRLELFLSLRRFKVSITRREFTQLFRVIDPDQSHSIKMDEWMDFMMAVDSQPKKQQKGAADSPRP
jgi:hypothetical protein